ncbi:MAG: type II secretion system protein [Candidatus Riflebacteria bacterium]|nr:type II secretion system protein [Candidatus Riflebacteria bacterium]
MRLSKKAFTLVEIIIGAAILALIISFIIPFIRDSNKMAMLATVKGTLRQEAQMVLRTLEKDIAASRAKFEKFNDDGTEVYKAGLVINDSFIEMEVPDTKNSSQVLLFETADDDNASYVKVKYTWANGKLIREHQTEGTSVLARHVKKIDPQNDKNQQSYDGKVYIQVFMEEPIIGTDAVASHTELLVVAVRQLQTKMLENMPEDMDSRRNKYWRQKIKDE